MTEMNDAHPVLSPEILVPRLGEHLIMQGLIDEDQLMQALYEQSVLKKTQGKAPLLGEILVDLGFITREKLDNAITQYILQLREALIETNQKLEQRVESRTAELQKAMIKLAELNQLKANFIANISHELRTPLTHIKGYEELLLSGQFGSMSDEQTQVMHTIQRATMRLERLIEDLILYASSERTQMPVKPVAINLVDLCRDVVEQIGKKAADQRLDLSLRTSELPLVVHADREKLTWVLFQLVDNAIKFTPSGGSIHLDLIKNSDFVQVKVSDTGIGIPENRIDEVFEPFHQLDGSSTRKYSGTGLGLSLVKKILDAHDTTIQVESQLGKGSQFSFILPLVSPSEDLGCMQ